MLAWRQLKLEEYDYEIVQKPGKINRNADTLSRIKLEEVHHVNNFKIYQGYIMEKSKKQICDFENEENKKREVQLQRLKSDMKLFKMNGIDLKTFI